MGIEGETVHPRHVTYVGGEGWQRGGECEHMLGLLGHVLGEGESRLGDVLPITAAQDFRCVARPVGLRNSSDFGRR